MIKPNEIKIDVISVKPKQQDVDNQGSFVKIEHLESGLTVTWFSRSSIDAKNKAMLNLNKLVDKWNRV